jgi:hypothetical protein
MSDRTTRTRLLLISRLLGKVPSIIYAATYLLLIPIFAFIYNALPRQFYHSTIKYEQILNKDNEEIRQKLEKQITDIFQEEHGKMYQQEGDLVVDIDNLQVGSFEMNGDIVKFSFSIPLDKRGGDYHEPSPLFNAEISFPLTYVPVTATEDDYFYGSYVKRISARELTEPPVFKTPVEMNSVLKIIFPREPETENEQGIILFPLNMELLKRFDQYSSGQNGFASDLSGNYWRMLYLSAATITTLGYGDIVAVTNEARILVSVEAILGIILIGLFLNALGYERE